MQNEKPRNDAVPLSSSSSSSMSPAAASGPLPRYEGGKNGSGDRHGAGVYYYENGDRYDGEWSYNHKNGFGCYYSHTTSSFSVGRWRDGKENGLMLTYISKNQHLRVDFFDDQGMHEKQVQRRTPLTV